MTGFSFFENLMGGGFPGGFPGGHPGHPGHDDEDDEPIDTEHYYELLGITKNATDTEIKKAYRKKARELHPDRHPNDREKYEALFQEVQSAHEVLKDSKKRSLYDKYGAKAAQRGSSGRGHDVFDLFNGRRAEQHGQKQAPPIKRTMTITLEDAYRGSNKNLSIKRSKTGKGSRECSKCHGQGVVTVVQRMGPMMLQQRTECSQCGGKGYQLATETVTIEVHIPVGARNGESVTVHGEGNRYPDHEPGDVMIKLNIKKHDVYKRQGADLGMNHTLSLRQALCGYKLRLRHVSGKTLIVTPKEQGEVVQPGSLKRIYLLGMPQRFSPHVKGHLYIVMEVQLPMSNTLPSATLKQFGQLLPNTECENDFGDEDELRDSDTPMSNTNTNSNTNSNSNSNRKNQRQKAGNNRGKKNKRGRNRKNKKNKNQGLRDMFGGLYEEDNSNSNSNKKKRKKQSQDEEELVEHVEATNVDDNPKATPASARNIHDEDDERDGVQCRQM